MTFQKLFRITLIAIATVTVLPACTTFGTIAEDNSIESRVRTLTDAIEAKNQPAFIGVDSHNLYVLIYGQVPTQAVKNTVTNEVRDIPEIRKIFNELRVADPEKVSTMSDSWITTKVKSSLAAEKGLDSKRINVVTEAGEVFLMGLVTREEGDKAALVARNISGVKKVIKIFEYIN
ncbi:BON domain-containing protein [Kangiella sediminilitoris]|uniref:Transport-associated protein n=1 Tax=Kangiella sediminilitoris TaxID=1144748 RepID=A0A1B3BCK0_9GAMM|nr:BON domain-containing protein [Kangiella sediminilitoris]AOE50483.1 transport-associated protein [Kangiella sediminilitoris]